MSCCAILQSGVPEAALEHTQVDVQGVAFNFINDIESGKFIVDFRQLLSIR